MLIHGQCHCGNIAFTLDWLPEPTEIPARACTCSFCTRHGAVWASCPEGSIAIKVTDPKRVTCYTFATRTTYFQICAICGVVPLVTSRIDGKLFALVNVNAFVDVDKALLQVKQVSFEGEAETDRVARRRRNWIGKVEARSSGQQQLGEHVN